MLTDSQCRTAKPKDRAFKLSDGGRLFLLINPGGTKSWFRSYRFEEKDTTIGYGPYPAVSLADARAMRDADDALLARGVDPRAARQQAKEQAESRKTNTLAAVTTEWLAIKRKEGKSATIRYAEAYLTRYVIDAPIGQKPIDEIKPNDIYRLIHGIAQRK